MLVHKNACFNSFGHGYFLEDGDETGNIFDANIAIYTKKMPSDRALLQSDFGDADINRFPGPASFWIAHPSNTFVGNAAVASEGTGFWSAFVSFKVAVQGQPGTTTVPVTSKLDVFDHNEASSCLVGMNWDGAPLGKLAGNVLNPNDRHIETTHFRPPVTSVFRGLAIYKSTKMALYLQFQI